MIAGIAFLILSPQSQLPLVDLGGVRTPVTIPTWKPDPVVASALEAGGWTYRFVDGKLVGRSRSNNGWEELTELGGKVAADSSLKWPMKIFVSSGIDQVAKTSYGFWMNRKYSIDGDELRGLRRETALFTYMVRAYTGGRVEIQPDFEVDTEMVYAEIDQAPEDVIKESLLPRLISAKPYRSCFAVTSVLDYRTPSDLIGKVPTTYLPFYGSFDPSRPGMFARTMFNAWVEQLQASAQREGYRVFSPSRRMPEPTLHRDLPMLRDSEDAIRGTGMWQALADDAVADEAQHRPAGTSPRLWSEVADDPWVKLPALDPAGEKAVETDSGLVVGDLKFDFEVRGSVLSGDRLYVQDRYVDLFAAKLGSRKAIGFFPASGHVIVVFEGAGLAGNDQEILGERPPQIPISAPIEKTSVPFDAKEAEGLAVTGYFEAKTAVDSDRGAVGDIRAMPRPGHGAIRLLGNGTDQPIFNAAKNPLLQFWIKTSSSAPLHLIVEGAKTRRYRLFGRPMPFAGTARDEDDVALSVPSDSTWQQITILLNGANSDGIDPVSNVYLACPADAYYWSPVNPGIAFLIDDFRVSPLPANFTGTSTVPRSTDVAVIAEAQDPFSRAAWASNNGENIETLRNLILDRDAIVGLNAMMKFGTRKDAGSIPTLVKAARSFSPRYNRLVFEALAAQGSDEGWTAIRRAVTQGPFDLNKREAARQITNHTKESKLAGEISLLFVSPSWMTRREAAVALSKVEGNPAKIVSLSFINGSEPVVRAAAIRVADVTVPEVVDRLMSVLDPASEPSDYLRALAAAKLAGAKPDKATAAWKSLEKMVPEAIVVFLAELPSKPEYRNQVSGLQTHPDSGVKAAVTRWLSKAEVAQAYKSGTDSRNYRIAAREGRDH